MFDAIVYGSTPCPGGYIYGFSRYERPTLPALDSQITGRAVRQGACVFSADLQKHDHFSEALFLSELLGTSGHKQPRGISKKIMLDRLSRHFAISARIMWHQILLLVDEAQNMHEPEYQTLCNLENELEQMALS